TGDLPWYYLASLPLVLLSVGYGQFSFWHQVYATLVRPEGDVGPASPSALPPRRVAWLLRAPAFFVGAWALLVGAHLAFDLLSGGSQWPPLEFGFFLFLLWILWGLVQSSRWLPRLPPPDRDAK